MNAVPLVDVLPWEASSLPDNGRTILVTDSVETDGRFLLYTLASQYLVSHPSSRSLSSAVGTDQATILCARRVMWISCGTLSEQNVYASLKKIGANVPIRSPFGDSDAVLHGDIPPGGGEGHSYLPPLTYISVNGEVAGILECEAGDSGKREKALGDFLKQLYRRVRDWLLRSKGEVLIVLDDVSCLASLFDECVVYSFVQQVRALLRRNSRGCLLMRCSNDLAQEAWVSPSEGVIGKKGLYIGAGGSSQNIEDDAISALSVYWESCLVELADGIIDVLPLQSGYSREVHGRMMFTERMGGNGWVDSIRHKTKMSSVAEISATAINYSCSDQGVRAIRLRSGV